MAIAKTITLAPFVLAEYTILRLGYDICTKRLWLCLNIVGFNQMGVAVSTNNSISQYCLTINHSTPTNKLPLLTNSISAN